MANYYNYLGSSTVNRPAAEQKALLVRERMAEMLNRTCEMFSYENLPDTMPPLLLETSLQRYGAVVVFPGDVKLYAHYPVFSGPNKTNDIIPGKIDEYIEKSDEADADLTGSAVPSNPPLYFFRANLGGEPDVYYRPSQAIVANPQLKKSYTLDIGKDCAIIQNDVYMEGLLPVIRKYAWQLVELEISLMSTIYATRIGLVLAADRGSDADAVSNYISDVVNGKLSFITTKPLMEGVRTLTSTQSSSNVQAVNTVLDAIQSTWVAFYNEIGVDPNQTVKRQYVSAEEIASSTDVLMPLVDNMLVSRELGVRQINEMYGTNITVRRASAWSHKAEVANINSAVSTMLQEGGEESDGSPDEPDREHGD